MFIGLVYPYGQKYVSLNEILLGQGDFPLGKTCKNEISSNEISRQPFAGRGARLSGALLYFSFNLSLRDFH